MSNSTFGYHPEIWQQAKEEIRVVLIQVAQGATATKTVTYHEVAASVRAIQLEPRDPKLNALLGELSEEEVRKGRGMISALVVTQETRRPGEGFYEWAEHLGFEVDDPEDFWQQQYRLVIASHHTETRGVPT